MKHKLYILFLAFLWAGAVTLRAQGYNFETLQELDYNTNGSVPHAGLTYFNGDLYGTTSQGAGAANGAMFELNTDGSDLVDIHDFTYPNQATFSRGGFVAAGNTLFAAGYQGGSNSYGVIYSINPDGTGYTNLYVFTGGTDDGDPRGALVLSSNVLYGTTQGTGSSYGTVFSIQTNGSNFTTLYTFSGSDGGQPYDGLVQSGNLLYGTTYVGGSNNLGVIFSISTDGKTFAVLHNFTNTNGTQPAAELILSGGTLYGTASAGGTGHGTVFSIGTNGSNFTVIHNFAGGSSDGAAPMASVMLITNVLYGTTSSGGYQNNGTVFSIPTNGGVISLVHTFYGSSSSDGSDPESPLLWVDNMIYGTTLAGGNSDGDGTIFGVQLSGIVFAEQPATQTNLSVGVGAEFDYAGYSLDANQQPFLYQWRLNGVNIPNETNYDWDVTGVEPTNGGLVTIAVSDGVVAPNSSVATFLVPAGIVAAGNNNFSNRFTLPGNAGGVVDSDNTKATREPGEPFILTGNPGGKSIWFSWQAPSSGTAAFTTAGSAFDTIMGVFNGTSLPTLVREPSAVSDDDTGGYLTSKVTFNCTSGHFYNIVVDGYRGASGGVVLSWQTAGSSPTLPVITNAPPPITVVSNGASVTLLCQANIGLPTWFLNGQSTGVTATNYVINSMSQANVGSYVAQVTSSAGSISTQPSRLEINTLEDGSTDTNSVADIKFLDAVNTGFIQGSSGQSRRQDGGDTRGFSVSQTFSTVGASGEPGEPNVDGQIGGSPVWYVYVTPTNGSLVISTAGSSFNTILGVFIGPGNSFKTLTNIAGGYTTNRVLDGQPSLSLTNLPKGQTNYVVVDGYHGATGTVDLTIGLGAPVVISPPLQNQFALAGSNATFTVSATGATPLGYNWQYAGTNITAATNSSLTITNVRAAVLGSYTVVVSNLVSAASNSANLSLGTLPNITTQPVSHTIHTNATANLTVAASGTPSPSYQWLFDGNSAGSTTTTLSIPGFGAGNAGTYWVIVSNAVGTATSTNAVLALDGPYRMGAASLSGGTFDLQLIGATGSNYVLEASTNLVNWVRLATNNSPSGFLNLMDTNAANFKSRYYRAITN